VLELGGMGAPTFQVLDPEGKSVAILWGQDWLNIVADLLVAGTLCSVADHWVQILPLQNSSQSQKL
jgi:hypothetical protein